MKEVLAEHIRRYPLMEIRDVVKLLYQSEFGGGHMIMNPGKSLERLKEEYASYHENVSPVEQIGNGICRVYLSAIDEGLLAETLNRMFVRTADRTVGTVRRFEKHLEELLTLCEHGEMPFSVSEVIEYLKEYRGDDHQYSAVSHSEQYRNAYHPAYRVVAECYTRYYEIFLRIDRLLWESEKEQIVIAIDGMSGSGKSTLGRILQDIYDCNLFHMDDFFLRPEQRNEERFQEAGGNVDYERFREEVLIHLADKEGLEYRPYDCSRQELGEVVRVPYKRVNIIEGVYSQHPYFGEIYDLRFFGEISDEEQVRRIRIRNGEKMLERFRKEWIPMEHDYFTEFDIKKKSIPIK